MKEATLFEEYVMQYFGGKQRTAACIHTPTIILEPLNREGEHDTN